MAADILATFLSGDASSNLSIQSMERLLWESNILYLLHYPASRENENSRRSRH